MRRPNILYIHSHDTGRYIEPYGFPVSTPNLQKLAEGGVLFRQAFSAAPTCSPSRAALLTGQSAHSSGMLSLATPGTSVARPEETIFNVLADQAGYHTVLAGFEHISGQADPYDAATHLGYDRFIGARVSGFDEFENQAELAAEAFLNSNPTEPFFLDVGFLETHRVNMRQVNGAFNEAGQQGDGRFSGSLSVLPDLPEIRADVADLAEATTELDRKIGVVLDALEESGLAENTLVICTTDHGLPFPGMKCTLTDHGLGVMLILKGPGGFQGGQVSESLVSQIDIFPTICDLIGIPRPDWLEGNSLIPLLHAEQQQTRDAIFGEVNWHVSYEPQRCIRTSKWKYIHRYPHDPSLIWPAIDTSSDLFSWILEGWPNCDPSPSKDVCEKLGWLSRPEPTEELYDLELDPQERNNLAEDERYAEVKAVLRDRLFEWMSETDDPILEKAGQGVGVATLG